MHVELEIKAMVTIEMMDGSGIPELAAECEVIEEAIQNTLYDVKASSHVHAEVCNWRYRTLEEVKA